MTAIIVFAHGSTVEDANAGVREMTAAMAARGRYALVDTAFLDCASPGLSESVAQMATAGATRIVVVPFFLTLGIHLRRDLPGIVDRLRSIHQGVTIEVASPLEGHPGLIDIMVARAAEALEGGASAGEAG